LYYIILRGIRLREPTNKELLKIVGSDQQNKFKGRSRSKIGQERQNRKNLKIDASRISTKCCPELSFLTLIPHQKVFVGCTGALREL